MQLIDTHSHIDVHHFAADFDDVLYHSRQAGVAAQILPGVCRRWWANLLAVCDREPDLYPAVGLHPMYLDMHTDGDLDELHRLAASKRLVALGEVGLDYFIGNPRPRQQQELFEAQIDIAAYSGLPLLLHVRKAHDQVQATLRRKRFTGGGIVHAYGGSLQQAGKYIELGFKISFGGTITYDRATKVRKIAQSLPIDSVVVETDAPDIPPASHHGERNSPAYLPEIVKALSQLRNQSCEQIAAQTTRNVLEIITLDGFEGKAIGG